MFIKTLKKNTGFTLIELLVVIAIISLLSSVVLVSIKKVKSSATDNYRVQSLKAFEQGLNLYYLEYGKYPGWNIGGDEFPGGDSSTCYTSYLILDDGSCSEDNADEGGKVRYDNSASSGFLDILYTEGFVNEEKWNDPMEPIMLSAFPEERLKWNCRYIVKTEERDANNVQQYFLHCRVGEQSYVSTNDAGTNPNLFEIQKPEPWLCVTDNTEMAEDYCN